jgi:hypothetical protein
MNFSAEEDSKDMNFSAEEDSKDMNFSADRLSILHAFCDLFCVV